MLYTYQFIDHPINQLQENISYFFDQLFLLEPNPYNEALVLKAEFTTLIASSGKFKKYLKDIAEQYIALPNPQKDIIKKAYTNHANIENICSDTTLEVVKFDHIINANFRSLLKDFLTWLWDDYGDLPQALRNQYKDVQDHFNEFRKVQKGQVCPFCGINGLKPRSDRKRRNAYDHYIPKATYPFISINFKNLFPACHECNSDEKHDYDTPFRAGVRSKVIYPFDTTYSFDTLTIYINPQEDFNKTSLKTLLGAVEWDIRFTLTAGDIVKYEAWNDIFKIKTRYKEYIQQLENTWFDNFIIGRYREDVIEDGLTFDRYKSKLIDGAKNNLFDDDKSILKYIYFNFIFSIPNIEDKLKKTFNY